MFVCNIKGGRGRLVREGCHVEELKQLCYYLRDLTEVSCYYYCCLVVKFKCSLNPVWSNSVVFCQKLVTAVTRKVYFSHSPVMIMIIIIILGSCEL